MPTIPFTLPDLLGGLKEVKGSLWMDEEFIVIHIETLWLGEISEDKQTVKLDPNALKEAYIKTGLVKDRLCLIPKKPELLDVMPGEHLGELQLRIWRKHRRAVEDLLDEIDRARGRRF